MPGLPHLRIRIKRPRSASGSLNSSGNLDSGMQLRSAAMAGKDDNKKRGTLLSAEGEAVGQKKTKNASTAANPGSVAEQLAFKAGLEAEFEMYSVATDR
jgi:hypothetical protein